MPTTEQKTILENAADLLEESGHASAQVIRELIRDNRLETLLTFVLHGGFVSFSRSEEGGVRLQSIFGDSTRQTDIVVEKIHARGVEVILSDLDRDISRLEKLVDHRICERGETPLTDCLARVDSIVVRGCPRCRSQVAPAFEPVMQMMTCNACGFHVRVPTGREW